MIMVRRRIETNTRSQLQRKTEASCLQRATPAHSLLAMNLLLESRFALLPVRSYIIIPSILLVCLWCVMSCNTIVAHSPFVCLCVWCDVTRRILPTTARIALNFQSQWFIARCNNSLILGSISNEITNSPHSFSLSSLSLSLPLIKILAKAVQPRKLSLVHIYKVVGKGLPSLLWNISDWVEMWFSYVCSK